jgi:hypothetical protein
MLRYFLIERPNETNHLKRVDMSCHKQFKCFGHYEVSILTTNIYQHSHIM